eukprot:CAMPEP_0181441336 /NCGR_PEP_ID=MMETSP1110-20121109/23455_1 /TAXON_ID=174948 /ORGANISM="Symbiodinium sp., Strain CCMP421" /LENGTH=87 /DNA_ID=CAMNT_0023565217 /DNA_START=156 /DNA_END=419 /DNA_ORIENTATION=-
MTITTRKRVSIRSPKVSPSILGSSSSSLQFMNAQTRKPKARTLLRMQRSTAQSSAAGGSGSESGMRGGLPMTSPMEARTSCMKESKR